MERKMDVSISVDASLLQQNTEMGGSSEANEVDQKASFIEDTSWIYVTWIYFHTERQAVSLVSSCMVSEIASEWGI